MDADLVDAVAYCLKAGLIVTLGQGTPWGVKADGGTYLVSTPQGLERHYSPDSAAQRFCQGYKKDAYAVTPTGTADASTLPD